MKNIFYPSFWLNLRPGNLSQNSVLILGAFIVIMAALFTFLKIMKDRGYNSKLWSGIADFSFTNALLACLLIFFTTELVPFFSARFWFLVWLAEMILWLWLIFRKKKISKLAVEQAEKDRLLKKYLPK